MERNKSKMVMVVTIAAILGIGTYAFADWGGYGMGGHSMMGGHGMMGGGSMGNFGQDSWNGSRPNMRNFNQNDLSDREGIETLRRKIDQKRKELATLYRSDDADKTQIDNKIDELSSLERSLDEKISSYGTGR